MTRIGEPLLISANPQLASLGGRDAINELIGSWLSAWQHKDLDGCFRHYRNGFIGPSRASHDEWRVDRAVKEVRLRRRTDGTLEIKMERNTSVDPQPLVRLLPSNAVAFNALARSLAEHRL